MPPSVEKTHPQRLQQPHTRIIGGTAAQPEDDARGTRVKRLTDQLTGAETTGQARVTLLTRHPMQTAGCGHFDHRRALPQPAPVRLDRRPHGATHLAFTALTPDSSQYGIDRTLAAIGHGPQQTLGLGKNLLPTAGDGSGHVGRAKALLEGIRSNDDFHGRYLERRQATSGRLPVKPVLKKPFIVAPAKAGAQDAQILDSRLRGNDGFLQSVPKRITAEPD